MIFCQNFAGAIFVVIGEVIFREELVKEIKKRAPSVSVDAALAAGARPQAIRALVPKGSPELAGVLLAFANSLDKVFYLLLACCLAGFVAAFGMGWVDTRKKKTLEAKTSEASTEATMTPEASPIEATTAGTSQAKAPPGGTSPTEATTTGASPIEATATERR